MIKSLQLIARLRLATLRYATVASQTNSSQDVNNSYLSDARALGDAKALRASLNRQIAASTSSTQTTALQARLRATEASIARDQQALAGLTSRVDFSDVQLTITSGGVGATAPGGTDGRFGVGRAAHDAGRILTVAAGVALIALAVLAPVVLLLGLGIVATRTLRRRAREHALDAA